MRKIIIAIITFCVWTIHFSPSLYGGSKITLEEIENLLKESKSLDVTGLWQRLEIVPQKYIVDGQEMYLFWFSPKEETPWILKEGTWEYVVISPEGVEIRDEIISGAFKIVHIRDNRWNHQFLIFVKENAQLIYQDYIALTSQRGIHPEIHFAKLSGGFTVFSLVSLARCGQLSRSQTITVYVYSNASLIPALTVLKSGFVYGGESSCDREYAMVGDGVIYQEPNILSVKYQVNYFGIPFGYGYDEKYAEEEKKMLLSSVEKTAYFVWNGSESRYILDKETSTLAEEDIEVIMCHDSD